ncbi:integrase catalytic domain-containing protein [Nephila pilipes]|uniref:Integrase catalytic domain-containing protein n=1 Tax=Nephila pilipes TaxID=299642 RepID=A0A8X6IEP2_NEPPI|nr:integrase catalytic domain-containing protein [Nephila pilipes]
MKGLKLADITNSDANVSVLIGADNYYYVMTGRIKRISRKFVAAESLYGWCLIGISGPPNKNSSDSFAMKVVVEEDISKQFEAFWQLENLGIEPVNENLNYDVLGGQSTVASAYTTSVECVQIFSEANMPLHKWATNSAELRELWEKNGFSIETSSNSIGQKMINYKVLGISWDTDRDIFYFDMENLLSFISKGTDTKRFLLQVAGRIFDPLGLIAPYVIRLKVLIQNVWEMGLLWDQEMPQIVKKPFKEWELKDSELWWHGPPWLKQTEQFWPKIEKQNASSLNLELKSKFRDISQNEVILENREKLLNIAKFSSYLKLLRVTAFVFRYIYNTRNTLKKRGAVNTEELKKSEEYWIKEIQKETYGSEIIDLEKTQKVSDCSKIRSLVPYLDDRQILRIKGRLDESELSLDEKQPILLPQNSKFTELLILREHTKNFHSGVTTTLILLMNSEEFMVGSCGKYCNQGNHLASTPEGAALHHNDITFNKPSGNLLCLFLYKEVVIRFGSI